MTLTAVFKARGHRDARIDRFPNLTQVGVHHGHACVHGPPEQYASSRSTGSSDIYFYLSESSSNEAVTGVTPFRRPDPEDGRVPRICTEPHRNPSEIKSPGRFHEGLRCDPRFKATSAKKPETATARRPRIRRGHRAKGLLESRRRCRRSLTEGKDSSQRSSTRTRRGPDFPRLPRVGRPGQLPCPGKSCVAPMSGPDGPRGVIRQGDRRKPTTKWPHPSCAFSPRACLSERGR